jgi:SAM-dependent methyltransferase
MSVGVRSFDQVKIVNRKSAGRLGREPRSRSESVVLLDSVVHPSLLAMQHGRSLVRLRDQQLVAFEERPTPAQQRPNRAHQSGLQFALSIADGINEAWARIVRMHSDPDLFGHALLDWTAGGTEPEFIERADGLVVPGGGRDFYLAKLRNWPLSERSSLRYARGQVVDIGCGAGRVPLHLQERGFDVVGIDVSRRAVRAARLRGVKEAWLMSAQELSPEIAAFDTIILFGNNFGIFGSPERVRRVLIRWWRRTRPGTRILAESTNPYCGGAPAFDRAFYHRNKALRDLPGQIRLRTRYRDRVGPWSNWLFVSRNEMRQVVRGTGWHVRAFLGKRPSESFVAVLEKE